MMSVHWTTTFFLAFDFRIYAYRLVDPCDPTGGRRPALQPCNTSDALYVGVRAPGQEILWCNGVVHVSSAVSVRCYIPKSGKRVSPGSMRGYTLKGNKCCSKMPLLLG